MTAFSQDINLVEYFFLGIYGKLDVLYAGIVAENACAENKNRSVSCHAFVAKLYNAEVGHYWSNYWSTSYLMNVLIQKYFFMSECCFHQWKYFFFCPWRFLVFFDDGFAQYLPVKKLHHVYHTGIKCLRV